MCVCVQWEQMADVEWSANNCRMVDELQFMPETAAAVLSETDGLDFVNNFAMRGQTQLRPEEDMLDLLFRVHSNDGFSLSIFEVGTTSADGDVFHYHPTLIETFANPYPCVNVCRTMDKAGIDLYHGKIYIIDVKYWQNGSGKCLHVRHRTCGNVLVGTQTHESTV